MADKLINDIESLEYIPFVDTSEAEKSFKELLNRSYIEHIHKILDTPESLRSLDILTEYDYVSAYSSIIISKADYKATPYYSYHITIKLHPDGTPSDILYENSSWQVNHRYSYSIDGLKSYGDYREYRSDLLSLAQKTIDEVRLLGACIKRCS